MIYSLIFPALACLAWLACFIHGRRRDNPRTSGQVLVCALYAFARWVESVSKLLDAYVLTVARGADHAVVAYRANQAKSLDRPLCMTYRPMAEIADPPTVWIARTEER